MINTIYGINLLVINVLFQTQCVITVIQLVKFKTKCTIDTQSWDV